MNGYTKAPRWRRAVSCSKCGALATNLVILELDYQLFLCPTHYDEWENKSIEPSCGRHYSDALGCEHFMKFYVCEGCPDYLLPCWEDDNDEPYKAEQCKDCYGRLHFSLCSDCQYK